MNIRMKNIIQYLLDVKEPVTSSELATTLQVSSKTVRNEIKELNRILRGTNAQIESYRGKGYHLIIKNEESFNKFLQELGVVNKEYIPSQHSDRVRFLMEKLLFHHDYIKLEDLADNLYISRSTLQNDLKTVREILKKYHLSIVQKPHYGIKVIGNEMQIRFCISEYLCNQVSSFIDSTDDWLGILSKEELEIIKNDTLINLRKHKIIISDISLQNLITHIAIACKRIREGNFVEMIHDDFKEIKNKKEFHVAKEILGEIESNIGVCFSENEVAYVAIHLQGTKLTYFNAEKEEVMSLIDDKIIDIVKEMIKRIDEKLHLHLQQDEELVIGLSLHLKPAINRYKHNMNIRNPMLDEIKAQYPLSFEAALIGKDVLAEKLNVHIDENEVGYLALHIEVAQERLKKNTNRIPRCLIVCASGLGSAKLLQYKLQTKYGDQLNIIGTTEYYNLSNQSLQHVNFIISTIPIREKLPVPVITVSTILGDTDIAKIEKMVHHDLVIVEQYLRKQYTFLNKECQTYKDVIYYLCDKLLKDKKVDGTYVNSILKRESYSPTSFGNLVAIPHPLEPQTDETFWAIMTLKKPILWIDKPVQFVVLLNIGRNNETDLKPMYNLLLKLMDNRNMVNMILQCKTYDQLKGIIKGIE